MLRRERCRCHVDKGSWNPSLFRAETETIDHNNEDKRGEVGIEGDSPADLETYHPAPAAKLDSEKGIMFISFALVAYAVVEDMAPLG